VIVDRVQDVDHHELPNCAKTNRMQREPNKNQLNETMLH
jgi:hypothetical protein